MNILNNFIQTSSKSKLMSITFAATIAAPYIYSLTKSMISNTCEKINKQKALYVGIQLGGTNYNVAIGKPVFNSKGEIMDFNIIVRKDGHTYEDPQKTISEIVQFLRYSQPIDNEYDFIGIASFGPLCLDKTSPKYGSITTTPKKLWRNIEILNIIKKQLKTQKVKIDTDVNSCAYAEFKLGYHMAKSSLVYITVGTGVGVGVVVHGKTVHGLTHPEGGHILVQRHPEQYQKFMGVCPFHQNCLQGMVCNKSIAERLNIQFTHLHEISDQQKVWKIVAYYLAELCLNITLTISPEIIVIGGGIMNRQKLYKLIRTEFIKMLAKYVDHPLYEEGKIQNYIKHPKLGSAVGVKGAMMLKYLNKQ